ncbi:MAG: hypothetical protein AAF485_25585 [Chloroflexota bacterium]
MPLVNANSAPTPNRETSTPSSTATSAISDTPNPSSTELPQLASASTSNTDDLDLNILGRSSSQKVQLQPEAKTEVGDDLSSPVSKTLPVTQSVASTPEISSAVQAPISSTPDTPVELLRLLRDPQSGHLILEVAGHRYTKLVEVTDKTVGEYILSLVAHLLNFTNGMIATNAGLKSVYTPKVGPLPDPPASSTPTPSAQMHDPVTPVTSPASSASVSEVPPVKEADSLVPKPSPEAEAAFRASMASYRAQSPADIQQPPPPPQRGGWFGRSSSPTAEPAALPPLNLADEINQIVQSRLNHSPLAGKVSVDIISDPNGGIRIRVNDQFYNSPDDIEDNEVRDLVKSSIKDWEQR